jgi:hypothetical protein
VHPYSGDPLSRDNPFSERFQPNLTIRASPT